MAFGMDPERMDQLEATDPVLASDMEYAVALDWTERARAIARLERAAMIGRAAAL